MSEIEGGSSESSPPSHVRCFSCKKQQPVEDMHIVTFGDGGKRWAGKCKVCGGKVSYMITPGKRHGKGKKGSSKGKKSGSKRGPGHV